MVSICDSHVFGIRTSVVGKGGAVVEAVIKAVVEPVVVAAAAAEAGPIVPAVVIARGGAAALADCRFRNCVVPNWEEKGNEGQFIGNGGRAGRKVGVDIMA